MLLLASQNAQRNERSDIEKMFLEEVVDSGDVCKVRYNCNEEEGG